MYLMLLKCVIFDICSTFGGNPLASAVAVASLKVVRDEGLVERYSHFFKTNQVICQIISTL